MKIYIVHYSNWDKEDEWATHQREPETMDEDKISFVWAGDVITFSRAAMEGCNYYAHPLEEGVSFVIKEVDWTNQLKTS